MTNENDNFLWLLRWYHSQCDGDWEHGNGIEIKTVDNSSWVFRVSIDETELLDKPFKEIRIMRSELDWIRCYIADRMFEGAGGISNLPELLQIFRDWAEDTK
jgi:hypothetical protein